MARKNLPKIEVLTIPNGYALTINDCETLHFTLDDLVEGFFIHVALGEAKYMDRQMLKDLMTACATWPKEGDAIQAAAKMQTELDTMRQAHYRDMETIRDLREKQAKMYDELTKARQKLARFTEPKPKPEPKPKAISTMMNLRKSISRFEAGALPKVTKVPSNDGGKKPVTIPYSEKVYRAVICNIADTGLPARVLSVLSIVGGQRNKTMGDVLRHTKHDLQMVRGCGNFVLEKLEAWMADNDVKMNMDVDKILDYHNAKVKI